MAKDLVYNFAGTSQFGHLWISHPLAFGAGLALALLFYSWIARAQRVLETGLMFAFLVYVLRGSAALFLLGPKSEVVYASIGLAIIAGGAYLLEAWDRLGIRVAGLSWWKWY